MVDENTIDEMLSLVDTLMDKASEHEDVLYTITDALAQIRDELVHISSDSDDWIINTPTR